MNKSWHEKMLWKWVVAIVGVLYVMNLHFYHFTSSWLFELIVGLVLGTEIITWFFKSKPKTN